MDGVWTARFRTLVIYVVGERDRGKHVSGCYSKIATYLSFIWAISGIHWCFQTVTLKSEFIHSQPPAASPL